MVDVPAATALRLPVIASTVATAVLLLLQVPPGKVFDNIVAPPLHSTVVPVMGAGNGFTVMGVITKQPTGVEYLIFVTPAETPVATPVTGSIVAIGVLKLLQVPPGVISLNVVVEPTHTTATPVIPAGKGFTVTTAETEQPAAEV